MRVILSILFIILSRHSYGQKIDWKSREIKSDTDLLKSTIWIASSGEGQDVMVGTGYFFYSEKKNKLFIITAKHVIDTFKLLAFHIQTESGNNIEFKMDSLQKRSLYFKSNNVDLAAIRIDSVPRLDLSIYKNFKVFTEKNIITNKEITQLNMFDDNLIIPTYVGLSMTQTLDEPLV